jgi:hypothetical protein
LKCQGDCHLLVCRDPSDCFVIVSNIAVLLAKQKVLEQALPRAVLVARLDLAHAAYHVGLGHQKS